MGPLNIRQTSMFLSQSFTTIPCFYPLANKTNNCTDTGLLDKHLLSGNFTIYTYFFLGSVDFCDLNDVEFNRSLCMSCYYRNGKYYNRCININLWFASAVTGNWINSTFDQSESTIVLYKMRYLAFMHSDAYTPLSTCTCTLTHLVPGFKPAYRNSFVQFNYRRTQVFVHRVNSPYPISRVNLWLISFYYLSLHDGQWLQRIRQWLNPIAKRSWL